MRLLVLIPVFVLFFATLVAPTHAEDDDWVVGLWQQKYDPQDKEIDTLEFTAEGDVYSRSSIGVYKGFYMVAPDMVKAVLSVGQKDLILTFFFNPEKNQLRIVTSDTGIATVYEKVDQ